MDGISKYIRFFRVRSPLYITGAEKDSVQWLFKSIDNVDFSYEQFIPEALAASQVTYGGISYNDLKNMEYDEYMKIMKAIPKLQPKEQDNE
jgi:hypothetical protein